MTRKCLNMMKSRQGKWKITMNEMSMERPTKKTFEGEIEGKRTRERPRWRRMDNLDNL